MKHNFEIMRLIPINHKDNKSFYLVGSLFAMDHVCVPQIESKTLKVSNFSENIWINFKLLAFRIHPHIVILILNC